MPDSKDKKEEVEEPKKYRVTVTISSLGNERRTIQMGEFEEAGAKSVIENVHAAFNVIRTSDTLTLTGADGVVTFANLDNVAFIEVSIV